MADPITDLYTALTTNFLCLLGAMAFVAFLIILLVVLYIKRVRREAEWAYNPEKTFKLRWRRG